MGAPPPQVLSKFPIIQTGLTKTNSKNTFLQNQNVSFSAFGKLFQVRKTLNRNILNEISSVNVIKLFDDFSVTQKLDESNTLQQRNQAFCPNSSFGRLTILHRNFVKIIEIKPIHSIGPPNHTQHLAKF